MEVRIKRTYGTKGTNGVMTIDGKQVCYTIELPWKDNARRISCIPEGTYGLVNRTSQKYKKHLLVTNTGERSLILIHPANNALKELAGCIAPVTKLTGEGLGNASRIAFNKVMAKVTTALKNGEAVNLIIQKA